MATSENDRQDQEEKISPQPGVGLVFIIIGVAAVLVVLFLMDLPDGPWTQQITYSQFVEAAEAEQVRDVVVSENHITWTQVVDEQEMRYRANRIPGVDDSALLTELRDQGVSVAGEPPGTNWYFWLIWLIPILLIAFIFWRFIRGAAGIGRQYQSFGESRARLWEEGTTKVNFDNVAGVDEAVTELREVVDFLQNPDKYTQIGAHIPKGVILVGPPGTGKTLLARATAGEARVPFFTISGADFVEMFVGVGAARARDLFRKAREKAPCIVFIDELDALGRRRAGARSPVTNEEREQTLNQLLVEIDGFDSSIGVIIMAATNRPDLLDPALQRPGRFDRQIMVDKPDLNGREAILRVHAKNVKFEDDVDLRVVAGRTPGFAGAELANVINESALLAVRRGRSRVSMEDLDEAVNRVMAGLERKSRLLIPKERKIIAHHEMGHALLGMLLPHADPVHKVSIIPRGKAALGTTIQAPLEDRYLLTQSELHDRIVVLLGGRAAEDVIFGEVSTGSADDLHRATALARRMVTQFGMTHDIGPVALEDISNDSGGFILEQRAYSEDTSQHIDREVKRLVDEAYEEARSLLATHRDALVSLASLLLEKEVIDGEEIAAKLDAMGIERLPANEDVYEEEEPQAAPPSEPPEETRNVAGDRAEVDLE